MTKGKGRERKGRRSPYPAAANTWVATLSKVASQIEEGEGYLLCFVNLPFFWWIWKICRVCRADGDGEGNEAAAGSRDRGWA